MRTWIRQAQADRGERNDQPTTADLEELRRLRRENAELRRANEIPKAATREKAENALFAYIDGWYNTERIQARLGWRSPDDYEAAWHTAQAVQHDQPTPDNADADPTPTR